ncbi:hypothetical protein FA15DRAFT_663138 [Coprinopsis marcescibilis]|uniref:EF-hand domain-containing protein n=1 Tax=Coprinopsis marcescibilis TaxID=230819 RepID=A0A5C3LD53_COPMA|nr:hypothetical protein FA15DRAFT_663138 [Coprinopsis marcescibilis]
MSGSSRFHGSLRSETPEPSSLQGRRNAGAGVQLLDAEGGVSEQLEACLKHIFSKYCTPPVQKDGRSSALLMPPPDAYLSDEGLDEWARDTNGAPFSEETKEELVDFLDCTDDGCLTLKGFVQIYQLQTENDEEETWRDLSSHGFDRSLQLVYTRREDTDETMSDVPEEETVE